MDIVANKLKLDPNILSQVGGLSPRWLLRFLTHQLTHIPTDEGNPDEISIIGESKDFLQLPTSQIMGGVIPNIETRDFKQRFEKFLKGSKALLYVAQGNDLFESGKLSRTIKKERKGKKQAQVGEISLSQQLQLALIPQMYNNIDGYNVSIAMALDSISQNLGLSWFQEQTQKKGKKTRRKNRGGRRRKKTRRKRRKSKRRR